MIYTVLYLLAVCGSNMSDPPGTMKRPLTVALLVYFEYLVRLRLFVDKFHIPV